MVIRQIVIDSRPLFAFPLRCLKKMKGPLDRGRGRSLGVRVSEKLAYRRALVPNSNRWSQSG